MPLLTTQSAKGYGWSAASAAAATNSYESIQTVTVTSAVSSIAFTSIPATYKNLQIRYSLTAAAPADTGLRFNSDSGANYSNSLFRGTGSAAQIYPYSAINQAYVQYNIGNNTSVAVIDILDYTNTNKNTSIRSLAGFENVTTGELDFWGGGWYNTAAVTRIDLHCLTSTFSTNSTFALYGIKG
jgi:hypothetical protein